VEEHDEPVMKILPRATLVDTESFIAQESGTIVQIETGYEHLLLLTGELNTPFLLCTVLVLNSCADTLFAFSAESGDLYGTGCNTDGQLGLSHSRDVYQLTKIPLPESINSREGGIERIVAGGDTSGFITKSGKLFTWGNSVRSFVRFSILFLANEMDVIESCRNTLKQVTERKSIKSFRLST